MNIKTIIILLLIPFWAISQETKPATEEKHDSEDYALFIKDWPDDSKMVAAEVAAKYGKPDEITASMLMWKKASNYEKIIVYNKPVEHNFPMPHTDVMEIFVSYAVPVDKSDEIIQSDGSITIHRTKGILSSRCDKEESVLISLNCANDVATGKKTVAEARAHHAKLALDLKNGDKPEYSQKLMFDIKANAGDPDKPHEMNANDAGKKPKTKIN